jgi:hypothetical protein
MQHALQRGRLLPICKVNEAVFSIRWALGFARESVGVQSEVNCAPRS